MKTWMTALLIASITLAACGSGMALSGEEAAQDPQTPTPEPTTQAETEHATPEATASETSPSSTQPLKEQWRLPISNAIILFSACELMFETHFRYSNGEIDLERALFELNSEGDLISFATRGFVSGPVPNEDVAPLLFELEQQMAALIAFLDPIEESMIGSAEVLDSLNDTCGTLNDLQQTIINASVEAGLTWEEVDEIDFSLNPMISDFYDQIRGG